MLVCAWVAWSSAWAQVPRDGVVETLRGVDFKTRSGGAASGAVGDWLFTSAGYVETDSFIVPNSGGAGVNLTLQVTAFAVAAGDPAVSASWPTVRVHLDGAVAGAFTVTQATATTLSFQANVLTAGLHRLRFEFANPGTVNGQTRALYLRKVELRQTPTAALPGNAGTFATQSVTVMAGFYPSNEQFFGLTDPCDPALPGCRNILFARQMGANDITLTSECTMEPGANWCSPQVSWNKEEQALRVAIRYARSLGMTVTLKPFVIASTGEVLGAHVDVATGRFWLPPNPYEFFSSLESNIVRHAQIAREEGVSLLMVGAELGGRFTSGLPMNGYAFDACGRWAQLISRVRAAAAAVTNLPAGSPPSLKLTYSASFAAFFNDINANEAQYLCFWDKLDYIGLNAYPHLNLVPTLPATAKLQSGFNAYRRLFDPTNVNADPYDDMVLGYDSRTGADVFTFANPVSGYDAFDLTLAGTGSFQNTYRTNKFSTKWAADFMVDKLNEKFKASLVTQGKYPLKAMITEVGAPSSNYVQGYWGSFDEIQFRTGDEIYLDEQARALDGYLRAFHGDPRFVGISLWGLMPNHDPEYGMVPGWQMGHDFYGKPKAAEALCKWFKRSYTSGVCVGP